MHIFFAWIFSRKFNTQTPSIRFGEIRILRSLFSVSVKIHLKNTVRMKKNLVSCVAITVISRYPFWWTIRCRYRKIFTFEFQNKAKNWIPYIWKILLFCSRFKDKTFKKWSVEQSRHHCIYFAFLVKCTRLNFLACHRSLYIVHHHHHFHFKNTTLYTFQIWI